MERPEWEQYCPICGNHTLEVCHPNGSFPPFDK